MICSCLFLSFQFRGTTKDSQRGRFTRGIFQGPRLPGRLRVPNTYLNVRRFQHKDCTVLVVDRSHGMVTRRIKRRGRLINCLRLHVIFLLRNVRLGRNVSDRSLHAQFYVIHLCIRFQRGLFKRPFHATIAVARQVTRRVSLFVCRSRVRAPHVGSSALRHVTFFCDRASTNLRVLGREGRVPMRVSSRPCLAIEGAMCHVRRRFAFKGTTNGRPTTTSSRIGYRVYFFRFIFLPGVCISESSVSSFIGILCFPPRDAVVQRTVSGGVTHSGT